MDGKNIRMAALTFLFSAILAIQLIALASGFWEDFSTPALDPAWQVLPGLGTYSLTDRPGYLRYYLMGPRAHPNAWMGIGESGGWSPSLTLIRPFEGDTWTLKAKATYNLRWYGTGAQYQELLIAWDTQNWVRIMRGTDQWYGTNTLNAYLVSNGVWGIFDIEMKAPDDIVVEDWLRYTYWFEVVREGQNIKVRCSYDGTDYFTAFSGSSVVPVTPTQKVIITANVWTTAGSYVDWDYIYVTPLAVTATVDIDPNTLNLKSNGEFVTAYIELPSGYNVADIDLTTVQLDGISAITDPKYSFVTDPSQYLVDHDGDTIMERMVKFDRAIARDALTGIIDYDQGVKFYDITLKVTGNVAGTPFEGTGTITVIKN